MVLKFGVDIMKPWHSPAFVIFFWRDIANVTKVKVTVRRSPRNGKDPR